MNGADDGNNLVILPWTVLRSTKDIQDAADAISGSTRQVSVFPTSTGYALGHAAILLDRGPVCDAKTIDFASDGRNNDGFPPELAIRSFPLSDVTINGLAILGDAPDLVTYFERSILHGPGAFVEIANDYPDYARAMERKLLRELGTFCVGRCLATPDIDTVKVLVLIMALSVCATTASACRLALALGLDVSGSVDASEYRLQLNGLSTALLRTCSHRKLACDTTDTCRDCCL